MSGFKVFAPATVSNLACGFDILGFAIYGPGDEITVKKSSTPGVTITKILGCKGKLPLEAEKNTAGVAALAVLDHLGIKDEGMEMVIHKKMPFGSGMGSSAASAAAGAFAANILFGKQLSKRELLPFASQGEQISGGGTTIHLDNVAPSLLGGMVLCRDNDAFDVHRLYTPPGLYCTLIYPHIQILTAHARGILSANVSLKNHTQQSANLGGLIVGLYTSNFDLISRSLKDVIIEPQRASLIPGFYDVKKSAIDAGALGCSISGAGPSVFAITSGTNEAEACAKSMQSAFKKHGIESSVFQSQINTEGAILC